MQLPDDIQQAVAPLFQALPPDHAMADLVVPMTGHARREHVELAERAIGNPVIAARPTLVAAVWLYVDELDRSHRVSQSIEDPTGSYWHGIMHRREGDFSNSHYWFRKVGDHPAMQTVDDADYDGHRFIDQVEAATAAKTIPVELVARQRAEWRALFAWCAAQHA